MGNTIYWPKGYTRDDLLEIAGYTDNSNVIFSLDGFRASGIGDPYISNGGEYIMIDGVVGMNVGGTSSWTPSLTKILKLVFGSSGGSRAERVSPDT